MNQTEGYLSGNIGPIGACHTVCPGDKCDTCCKSSPEDSACLSVAVTDPEYEYYELSDINVVETKTRIDIGIWIYISFLGALLLGVLIYLILKNRFR